MALDVDQVNEDLRSGDAGRVRAALTRLNASWPIGEARPIEMPGPWCLAAFGDIAPKEVVSIYLDVLLSYPSFVPAPSPTEVWSAMVEAVVRYGHADNELTHALALNIRSADDAHRATEIVLTGLQRAGFEEPLASTAATRLVDWLLDSTKTRVATVEALRRWVELEDFPAAIEAARPRLEPTELELLHRSDE